MNDWRRTDRTESLGKGDSAQRFTFELRFGQYFPEVDDKPGGMARVARELADAGVNIHGHLFLGRWGDRAMFAFVVDKPDVAKPILERKA